MSGKNKGGREARKPKAAHNVKVTGQTPQPAPTEPSNQKTRPKD